MNILQSEIALAHTNISYLHVKQTAAKPVMIFLHGFPENSWTWYEYLLEFGQNYDVYAPDLPGYNGSLGFAASKMYTMENLIDTLVEFIQSVANGKKVMLVAHDWGGAIAWPLVAFHANIIEKFIVLNAAHPTTFTREMAQNPLQQKQSDYISDLVSDQAYEVMSKDNYKMLTDLYSDRFEGLLELQKDAFLNQWQDVQSMQNACAYYKCMPQLRTSRVSSNDTLKLPNIRIDVDTLVLWGMQDKAFVPQVLNDLETWVPNLTLKRYDDADHWLHHHNSKLVVEEIQRFLEQCL